MVFFTLASLSVVDLTNWIYILRFTAEQSNTLVESS